MSCDDDADIVDVILRACQEAGLDAAAARAIGERIRATFGGLRVRIPKRKKHLTPAAKALAFADGLTGMPTREVVAKHGISRSTLTRYMKRGGS